ncbi:MAG TPA: MEDS domain-containing protein, partial [Nitrososphaera sp.]|nr:MEDS domain-containing protein [Nitrososphaera sp.]
MIKNEPDNHINGGNSTSTTGPTSKYQEEMTTKKKSVSGIIEDIRRSNFHDHNMLIYSDLPTFRKIYSECTRQALHSNEIVFLATTYDPFDKVTDELRSKGISVDNETKDGNLVIVDAIRAYQIDTYGAMKLGKSLVLRAVKEGKSGVFNMSDMGSFFLSERIETLVEYERSLREKKDLKFKAICSYHKGNFGKLNDE